MHRPLFLEGEAGVGKTALAHALAEVTGRPLYRLQCYEGLEASQALYDWDFGRQLLHLRAAEAAHANADTADARGLALRPPVPARPAAAAGARGLPQRAAGRRGRPRRRRVRGVPARGAVGLHDLDPRAGHRAGRRLPPLVVLTSNRTREVHDALKRRCLYHWLEHPDFDREVAILRRRLPEVTEQLAREVARATAKLRTLDLLKPPGRRRGDGLGDARCTPSAPGTSTRTSRPARSAPSSSTARTPTGCTPWPGERSSVAEGPARSPSRLGRARTGRPRRRHGARVRPHAARTPASRRRRTGSRRCWPPSGALDVLDATDVYWAGRLTLCGGPRRPRPLRRRLRRVLRRRGAAPSPAHGPAAAAASASPPPLDAGTGRGGRGRRRRPRPRHAGQRRRGAAAPRRRRADAPPSASTCAGCSRCSCRPAADAPRPAAAGPSPHGSIHPARTVRRALRDGGEVTRLLHRRPDARGRAAWCCWSTSPAR